MHPEIVHFLRLELRVDITPSPYGSSVVQELVERDLIWDAVDYILGLSHVVSCRPDDLELTLRLGGSAWAVGTLDGEKALVRRVAEGVQDAAEEAFKVEKAGPELAKAWSALYGRNPDPGQAYQLAVKAVEHVAIPVVDPNNAKASLGTVASRLFQQEDWHLPMTKEHPEVSSREVVKDMCRVLWDGHAGRHGADAYGDVSQEDAEVAVGLAVTLVHWFSRGLVRREGSA